MKYCLKCGRIYAESYDDYENEGCANDRFPLTIDDNMTEEKFLQLSEEEKDAYELHVLELCKQSEFFDERKYIRNTSPKNYYLYYRFDKYEELSGKKAYTKENELYHEMKAKESVREAFARYAGTDSNSGGAVQCPYCKSTNTRKITTTAKAVNTALFGIFGTKRHKQWHCNHCGSEF